MGCTDCRPSLNAHRCTHLRAKDEADGPERTATCFLLFSLKEKEKNYVLAFDGQSWRFQFHGRRSNLFWSRQEKQKKNKKQNDVRDRLMIQRNWLKMLISAYCFPLFPTAISSLMKHKREQLAHATQNYTVSFEQKKWNPTTLSSRVDFELVPHPPIPHPQFAGENGGPLCCFALFVLFFFLKEKKRGNRKKTEKRRESTLELFLACRSVYEMINIFSLSRLFRPQSRPNA